MPETQPTFHPVRALTPLLALAIAACAAAPDQASHAAKPVPARTSTEAGAGASIAPETPRPTNATVGAATPQPAPSLSLLLEGVVKIDASSLIANKLAERTSSGVRLIGEHGAGLVSDNGYGIVANNGSTVISNAGGSIVSKVKYQVATGAFGLLAASVAPSLAPAHALVPIQGMTVSAVSLRDGSVLAGPVATTADGHFHLGFTSVPASNLRIVASVNNVPSPGAYQYQTLVPPTTAKIVTTDSTQAVTDYLVRILAGRLQHSIDARLQGETVEFKGSGLPVDQNTQPIVERFNAAIARVPPAAVALIDLDGTDQPGTFAKDFARRVLSFVKLDQPGFDDLNLALEELRLFTESLPVQPDPPLLDQFVALASYGPDSSKIVDVLLKYGMSKERADAYYARFTKDGGDISAETARAALSNYKDALGPSFANIQIPARPSTTP